MYSTGRYSRLVNAVPAEQSREGKSQLRTASYAYSSRGNKENPLRSCTKIGTAVARSGVDSGPPIFVTMYNWRQAFEGNGLSAASFGYSSWIKLLLSSFLSLGCNEPVSWKESRRDSFHDLRGEKLTPLWLWAGGERSSTVGEDARVAGPAWGSVWKVGGSHFEGRAGKFSIPNPFATCRLGGSQITARGRGNLIRPSLRTRNSLDHLDIWSCDEGNLLPQISVSSKFAMKSALSFYIWPSSRWETGGDNDASKTILSESGIPSWTRGFMLAGNGI